MEPLKFLIVIDSGILISIIIYGYKVITFFNDIKFKTDLMWQDYEARVNSGRYHKRSGDIK